MHLQHTHTDTLETNNESHGNTKPKPTLNINRIENEAKNQKIKKAARKK